MFVSESRKNFLRAISILSLGPLFPVVSASKSKSQASE